LPPGRIVIVGYDARFILLFDQIVEIAEKQVEAQKVVGYDILSLELLPQREGKRIVFHEEFFYLLFREEPADFGIGVGFTWVRPLDQKDRRDENNGDQKIKGGVPDISLFQQPITSFGSVRGKSVLMVR
jgi:hypothetical protein